MVAGMPELLTSTAGATDELTGKILTTRYLAIETKAHEHYGDRLMEAVPGVAGTAPRRPGQQQHVGVAALNAKHTAVKYSAEVRARPEFRSPLPSLFRGDHEAIQDPPAARLLGDVGR